MRRIFSVLVVMVVMVAMVVAAAAPAFAEKGGIPHEGSCGLGEPGAQTGIELDARPGASELAQRSPIEYGCIGN